MGFRDFNFEESLTNRFRLTKLTISSRTRLEYRLQALEILCNLPSTYIFPMLSYSARTKFLTAGFIVATLFTISACSNSVAGKRADSAAREERVQVYPISVKIKELRRNVESVV